jgi:hypothetical protein
VTVPAVLTVLTCALLGTIGWYFLGVAIAYNCGMSEISCGTAATVWLAAAGIGVWILAVAAAILAAASRRRPALRQRAAITCWVLLPAAVSWFLLAGRLT